VKGLSVEDQAFLVCYRATDRRRRQGVAQGWEVRWLQRYAMLASELEQRVQPAKAA